MKFGKKVAKEMFDLMTEIQDAFLMEKKGVISFTFDAFPDEDISGGDWVTGLYIAGVRSKMINKLDELGVISAKKIEKTDSKFPSSRFTIKINKTTFDKIYKELNSDTSVDPMIQGGVKLYLDKDGNFWHEPKERFCYPMGAKSERLKILSYLVDNKGFQSPESISEYIGGKKYQTIRTEIKKIRDNIKEFLDIEGKEVIEGKKDSGYRITSTYKIFKV